MTSIALAISEKSAIFSLAHCLNTIIMCEKHHKRKGATLQNTEEHQADHIQWSRRDFLTATGLLTAGGILLGNLPVKAFQPTPLMASLANGANDRILVLINFSGGNDGLNTVILRGNADYYNLRPDIAVQENSLWALSNEIGMPSSTSDLEPLWQEGMMKVIHNVGYPDPNYSHFRSFDIWATGSDSEENWHTGWMGRFLDNQYPAFLEAPPTVPPALQIGIQSSLIFKADEANLALAVSSPQEFYQIAQSGQLYDTALLGNTPRELELAFVRQTANAAFRYATTIKDAYSKGKNEVVYQQNNNLAEQLSIVAKLIKGGLGTKIYMVEIGGFDTHANQYDYHLNLLNKVASAVKSFFDDLQATGSGLENKVLGMTFSEFGRTIYQNGSFGTDHGAGTPVLLFGGGIGQGFHGTPMDLTNPDPYADPEFSVDFRDIYTTILQNWLGTPGQVTDFVMGHPHTPIAGLVPAIDPPLGINGECALLGHNPNPNGPGIAIKYSMLAGGPVKLQIIDTAGHVLRTVVNEYKPKGSYTFALDPNQWILSAGVYQYRLQTGGQVFQREFRI